MAPLSDPSRSIIARARGELGHPGSCRVCGGDDPERTYVDFGIYFDYEGHMYICSVCFDEAAQTVMGYFTPEQHLELLVKNNQLIEEVNRLTAEVARYAKLSELIDSIGRKSGPIIDLSDGNGILSHIKDDEGQDGDVKDGESGEPETPEPANDKGLSESGGTKPGDRSKPVIQ